jgi:hypothetical protein
LSREKDDFLAEKVNDVSVETKGRESDDLRRVEG